MGAIFWGRGSKPSAQMKTMLPGYTQWATCLVMTRLKLRFKIWDPPVKSTRYSSEVLKLRKILKLYLGLSYSSPAIYILLSISFRTQTKFFHEVFQALYYLPIYQHPRFMGCIRPTGMFSLVCSRALTNVMVRAVIYFLPLVPAVNRLLNLGPTADHQGKRLQRSCKLSLVSSGNHYRLCKTIGISNGVSATELLLAAIVNNHYGKNCKGLFTCNAQSKSSTKNSTLTVLLPIFPVQQKM